MRIEHWRYGIPLWLKGLMRRRVVEQDLDDELRDHLEQQIAANVASGMEPGEARRAALVAFGGLERIKDESRDARRLSLIDNIAQLRYAARSLWRARTFTVATITTIALAVGIGGAMFTMINAILLRPLPYPDSDRLVALWHAFPGMGLPLIPQSPGTYAVYRTSTQSFESIGAYSDGTVTISYGEDEAQTERVAAAGIAGTILPMLRTRPLIGRVLADGDEKPGAPPVVVISERLWRTRLNATRTVLGKRLRIDGADREIVGVLPASFAFPGSNVRVWLPINVAPGAYLGTFTFRAIGRLRPGVSLETAQRELQSVLMHVAERFPEQRPGVSTAAALEQAKAIALVHSLRDDAIGGIGRIVWLVGATIVVLILVALSNVASLVLARVEARQRELAVRSTLGASTARIWWSLIAETAMLSSVGGAIGWGLAVIALTLLGRSGATELVDPRLAAAGRVIVPRLNEIRPDGALALSALALTLLFCIASGLIASWHVAAADPLRVLREGGRSGTVGRTSRRVRAAFVIVEVALSLVLLSGSAVLGRSLLRLLDVHPGFNPASVLTFETPLARAAYRGPGDVGRFYREAVERLERIPGVVSAGVVSKLPLESSPTMRIVWVEDAPPATGILPPSYAIVAASGGYFRAMGIPLLAGRVFDIENVRRGDNEAVVGRSFVTQYWGDSTGVRGLGRRFRPYAVGPWYTIVGVVGDVRDTSLTASVATVLYLPEEPGTNTVDDTRAQRNMAFVVRSRGAMPGLAGLAEGAIREIDRNVPVVEFTPMSKLVSKAGARMKFVLVLLAAGAAATLALGVVGLYGVIAYVVGLRSREIGIRIALGLEPSHAARMILKEGERIILAGAVVGLLVFIAFARLLASLTFDVSVLDRWAIASSATIVLVVATVATWLPARRAACIDPTEALKSD